MDIFRYILNLEIVDIMFIGLVTFALFGVIYAVLLLVLFLIDRITKKEFDFEDTVNKVIMFIAFVIALIMAILGTKEDIAMRHQVGVIETTPTCCRIWGKLIPSRLCPV